MSPDDDIRALARRQLGLLRRDQLSGLGVSRAAVRSRVVSGALERLSPSVLRIGGAPAGARQSVLAGVFDAGALAAASHTSAAAIWKLPGYSLAPVHVTRLVQGNRRPGNLAVVHDPKLLLPSHLTDLGPLRVTTPSRTLFDLAATVHPERLARSVDSALAARLTDVRALHEMLRVLARRGRTGIRAMRAVLEDRPLDYRAPESHLEARAQRILRDAGLPAFDRQVDVGDSDGWIARVDFLHAASLTILQVDGDHWHRQLVDRIADATQDERLARAGYTVLRVTEKQVWLQPEELIELVRRHLLVVRDL